MSKTRVIRVDIDGEVLEFDVPVGAVVTSAVVGLLVQYFTDEGESWTDVGWRATRGPAATRVGLSRLVALDIESDAMAGDE